ncbi:hypothetical protein [Cellulomonas carbonis]|uniref:Uncharacterized protein n=1 Tax=Cellulomonas carbonis T26 TaxID=947969 RepID=A0A0A0BSK5_9CELL|nr:hypothetical protein [Cellulomonas carbonis]KGM10124.1 hypothetical protein N868_16540 [Cellulomonas carbonis T26]
MSNRPSRPARPTPPRPARRPPAGVVAVVAAVCVEALALAAGAVVGLVQVLRGTESAVGVALFLVVFALAVAAALVASARALWAGRRSGRAPVATWQLLQAATAFAVGRATDTPAAWVVLAVSVGVFVLLLTRPVVAHTVDH